MIKQLLWWWVDTLNGYSQYRTGLIVGILGILLYWLRRSWLVRSLTYLFSTVTVVTLPIGLFWPNISEYLTGTSADMPWGWLGFYLAGATTPIATIWCIKRYSTIVFNWLVGLITRPFARVRPGKTDIRTIAAQLPAPPKGGFDPAKYFNSKHGVFLGLNERHIPVYLPREEWVRSHVQILGTTGFGKGVMAGVTLTQSVLNGEVVVVVDPKFDEFLPHVLYQAARQAGRPYVFLDLQSEQHQWNPIAGKTAIQIEEMFTAGFGLGEQGSDADIYRIADRRIARQFAIFSARNTGKSLPVLFAEFYSQNDSAIADGAKLYGDLEELVESGCLQCAQGLDIPSALKEGGVVYVRGSMRNPRVKKLQKMFLLSCLQAIEERDRDAALAVSLFLDEFKYSLSRPALEALAGIRDKRAHVLLAHQSLADLKDCEKDLSPEAVSGSVIDNCAIKLTYRALDPETAEWLAKASGTILVDDETRTIERNFGQSEVLGNQRQLRQAESHLIEPNAILSLKRGCAVLYGVGNAQYVFTAPVQVEKNPAAVTVTQGQQGPLPETKPLAEELIDVD